MTTIERNFNGTVYRVTVKEEERVMRMVMGEEDSTLQEPRVTELALEETGSAGGPSSGLEESTVKVISLEVKVGQERGVLLQRWQQEGGEGEHHQVSEGYHESKHNPRHKESEQYNCKVRYTKEGLGGVTAAEVKASIVISFCIFNVNIITILNILSIIHIIILLRRCLPFSKTG